MYGGCFSFFPLYHKQNQNAIGFLVFALFFVSFSLQRNQPQGRWFISRSFTGSNCTFPLPLCSTVPTDGRDRRPRLSASNSIKLHCSLLYSIELISLSLFCTTRVAHKRCSMSTPLVNHRPLKGKEDGISTFANSFYRPNPANCY